MNRSPVIIILVVSFSLGIFVGFALELYFQNNALILATIAIALAIAAWIGSGTDILGLLRDIYRDRRDEEKKPTLALDEISVTRQHLNISKEYNQDTYSIRVSIISGEGMVDDCHVYLDIKGTKIRHFPTVWTDSDIKYMPISNFEDAKLFTMTDHSGKKELTFWFSSSNPSPENPAQRAIISLEDVIERNMTITLRARNGNLPQPLTMTNGRSILDLDSLLYENFSIMLEINKSKKKKRNAQS